VGAADDYVDCGGGFDVAGDVTVQFTPPSTGRWAFFLDPAGTDFDSTLALYSSCTGLELQCADEIGDGGESLAQNLLANVPVVLVVDGYFGEEGAFELVAALAPSTEADCGDGLDEDVDGATDCSDLDCAALPECQEDCGTFGDEDGDLYYDCDDFDCAGDPVCTAGCPTLTLVNTLSSTNEGLINRVVTNCGGTSAGEQTVSFTAPSAGSWVFSVTPDDVAYEAILAVYDTCGGAELACETSFAGSTAEVLQVLAAGETVVLYVDGLGGTTGTFDLEARLVASSELDCGDGADDDFDGRIDCADADCVALPACAGVCPADTLTTSPGALAADTTGLPDLYQPSCNSAGGGSEVVLSFVAPATATYTFDTVGSAFDTVLAALDACGGSELDCDDDSAGGLRSELVLPLVAGQEVFLHVDGYNETEFGAVTLNVTSSVTPAEVCDDSVDNNGDGRYDCLDPECIGVPECATCAEQKLPSLSPFTISFSTVGLGDDEVGTCGGNGEDWIWEWTAPATAFYTFDTAGSTYDTVLYVRDGDCAGTELACDDDVAFPDTTSSVTTLLTAGQTVFVVVDGFSGSGSATLNIQ
jgi:hypothetical protein